MDTTTISKYVYTVNPIGQRTNLTQTGTAFAAPRNIAWGFDPLGQVTAADHSENSQDRSYQFDTIGNRQRAAAGTLDASDPTATVYTANALNQYTAVDTVNPSYDQDGNTLTEGNKTHTWDAENRLIKVQIGETEVSYQYDSQSRRIARVEGLEKAAFLYDGWNNIAEYSVGTSVPLVLSRSYTWGTDLSGSLQGAGGVGGLLSVTKFPLPLGEGQGEGVAYYPTYDGNGNISEYLDNTGEVAAHFEYDPFGNTTVNTDTENNFPYRFSTKPLDPTTNLYYYGYRDYEAPTGRWKSRDPIEEEGGVNLYGFVGNDGVNRWDELGLHNFDLLNSKSACDCLDIKVVKTQGEWKASWNPLDGFAIWVATRTEVQKDGAIPIHKYRDDLLVSIEVYWKLGDDCKCFKEKSMKSTLVYVKSSITRGEKVTHQLERPIAGVYPYSGISARGALVGGSLDFAGNSLELNNSLAGILTVTVISQNQSCYESKIIVQ